MSAFWAPTTLTTPSYLGVFVPYVQHLWELRFTTSNGWMGWYRHDIPAPNLGISSHCAAVAAPSGYMGVFSLGTDALWELASMNGERLDIYKHSCSFLDNTPSAVAKRDGYIGVFANKAGRLHEFHFVGGGEDPWIQNDVGPFGITGCSGYLGVFVISSASSLREYYRVGERWLYTDHPRPTDSHGSYDLKNASAVSAPGGYIGVFGSSGDGGVWERRFRNGWKPWTRHLLGGDPRIVIGGGGPIAFAAASWNYMGVFGVSAYGGELWELASSDGEHWTSYPHGKLPNGTPPGVHSLQELQPCGAMLASSSLGRTGTFMRDTSQRA